VKRFVDPAVKRVFYSYPAAIRPRMLALRSLIFETAASTDGVGELHETLKWGEPAYVTAQTRSGSTVRIHSKKSSPTQCAVYFNCQTGLVETFRSLFRGEFRFEGHRAIVFDESDALPTDALAFCIAAALTYHAGKSDGRRSPQRRRHR
jgi:hypothetical protein